MTKHNRFFNRELSWIEFNARVLNEACRKEVPLLERLKFLSIVTSNFDEFFMVRVAGLKQQMQSAPEKLDLAGMTAKEQLDQISKRVHQLIKIQYDTLEDIIMPELTKKGIHYITSEQYSAKQIIYLETLFQNEIFPLLTPLRTEDNQDFPYITNLKLHAAFLLRPMFETKGTPTPLSSVSDQPLAVVQIPTSIKRIVWLPSETDDKEFALLDDIIKRFGTLLFPGYTVVETLMFKVTKDADFAVDEDRDDDFIEAMEEVLVQRKSSKAVRMTCNSESSTIEELLTKKLDLGKEDVYKVSGMLDVATIGDLAGIEGFNELKYPNWKNFWPESLPQDEPLWDTLKQKDVLLHVPYESYEPVVSFVKSAAEDSQVLAIKMTLYRTSGNSPIVAALEQAALKGKQVTVFVELKARFDEQQNISWAGRLEQAGVIVVYGIANLKVHAKMLLVVRREPEGIRRYVHLSTGNYNDKTARFYGDLSLFTVNNEIGNDATLFFNMISGYSAIQTMRRLIMAPINLKSQLLSMIDREISHSTPDSPGLIMAKMNSLGHEEIIEALYRASNANVHVLLNVRGICMLVPGVAGMSENIYVTSIIDRYLEHSRIVYFQNGGNEEVYLSSADWMPRNLDRRVELLFPVLQENLFAQLKQLLTIYFSDNRQSHILSSSGKWTMAKKEAGADSIRVQEYLYQQYKNSVEKNTAVIPREFIVRRR